MEKPENVRPGNEPTCVVLYRTNVDGIVLIRADDRRRKIVMSGNTELESLTEDQLRAVVRMMCEGKVESDVVFRDASGEKPDRIVSS